MAKFSRKPGTLNEAQRGFIEAAEENREPALSEIEKLPWERDDIAPGSTHTFNLRLPAELYLQLKWIAKHRPESMHQIAIDALTKEVNRLLPSTQELVRLLKRE